MAERIVVVLDSTSSPKRLEEIQAGDTYGLPADTSVTGNLTVSGTVNGRDVTADGAVIDTAIQPGDNLSDLTIDLYASQGEAEAGVETTKIMTPLRVAQAIAVLAAGLKNKLDATTNPLPTNDDSEGYSVGSFWVDTFNDESYRCVDATTNVAVWVKTTLQSTDLATVALSGDSDDLSEGSVQLLMTAAERSKLTGIEANATADQTGAEIKASYEAEADTNAFTDAEKTKLSTVESGATADQTGAEIKAAYEAEADTNAFTDADKLANDLGWRDLRCSLVASATGTGTPALTAFGPTGTIKQLAFGVGDSVYVAAHIDHDIKPGSTIYPHVHWTTNGVNTATVKWELSYTFAAGHNQANFGPNTVVNLEEAAYGSAWRHMVTEDATGFTAPEVDSIIILEVKRITNGGTDNADTVFGLFVDFHYQSDRRATLNKSPDFYS